MLHGQFNWPAFGQLASTSYPSLSYDVLGAFTFPNMFTPPCSHHMAFHLKFLRSHHQECDSWLLLLVWLMRLNQIIGCVSVTQATELEPYNQLNSLAGLCFLFLPAVNLWCIQQLLPRPLNFSPPNKLIFFLGQKKLFSLWYHSVTFLVFFFQCLSQLELVN